MVFGVQLKKIASLRQTQVCLEAIGRLTGACAQVYFKLSNLSVSLSLQYTLDCIFEGIGGIRLSTYFLAKI